MEAVVLVVVVLIVQQGIMNILALETNVFIVAQVLSEAAVPIAQQGIISMNQVQQGDVFTVVLVHTEAVVLTAQQEIMNID